MPCKARLSWRRVAVSRGRAQSSAFWSRRACGQLVPLPIAHARAALQLLLLACPVAAIGPSPAQAATTSPPPSPSPPSPSPPSPSPPSPLPPSPSPPKPLPLPYSFSTDAPLPPLPPPPPFPPVLGGAASAVAAKGALSGLSAFYEVNSLLSSGTWVDAAGASPPGAVQGPTGDWAVTAAPTGGAGLLSSGVAACSGMSALPYLRGGNATQVVLPVNAASFPYTVCVTDRLEPGAAAAPSPFQRGLGAAFGSQYANWSIGHVNGFRGWAVLGPTFDGSRAAATVLPYGSESVCAPARPRTLSHQRTRAALFGAHTSCSDVHLRASRRRTGSSPAPPSARRTARPPSWPTAWTCPTAS